MIYHLPPIPIVLLLSHSIESVSAIAVEGLAGAEKELLKDGKSQQKQSVEEPGATGRWTDEEHQRFLEAYKLYGKNWKQIQKHIGTRNAAQARSHAQKYFAKLERAKNIANAKLQECTPLCSPAKETQKVTPNKESRKKPKTYIKQSKRSLSYNDDSYIEPAKKCAAVSWEGNAERVYERFQEDNRLFSLSSDYPSMLMNIQGEDNSLLYPPWDRELETNYFHKPFTDSPFFEESRLMLIGTEGEIAFNDYYDMHQRLRTLSSTFE